MLFCLNPYVESAANSHNFVKVRSIELPNNEVMYPILAHLRNSGARTIMCWKSSSDRRPSLSRSASSITFSHTILTSSSVSSLRVSLFSVFSRSDLQMKSSLLKSCRMWMKTHQERGKENVQLLAGCLRHTYQSCKNQASSLVAHTAFILHQHGCARHPMGLNDTREESLTRDHVHVYVTSSSVTVC